MTRELAAALTYQSQEIRDVLELLIAERSDLMMCDNFTIVERLWDVARDLAYFLEPKLGEK